MSMSLNWQMTPVEYRRDLLESCGLSADLAICDWIALHDDERDKINKTLAEMCSNRTKPQVFQFSR